MVNKEQPLPANVTQVVVPDTLRVASILAHTLFDYPSHQLVTFGVTGTNGKTSIATMIHLIQKKVTKNSAYLELMVSKLMKQRQKVQIRHQKQFH